VCVCVCVCIMKAGVCEGKKKTKASTETWNKDKRRQDTG